MRGKKCVLILTLTFLLGSIIASVPAGSSPTVSFYVKPLIKSGVASDTIFGVDVWIDSPIGWRNSANGIVGWTFDVKVNASVIRPVTANGSVAGYFLYDFLQQYNYLLAGYSVTLLFAPITPATGIIRDIAEMIMPVPSPGTFGAGGSGKLCSLWFNSSSASDYSRIDISDAWYWKTDGSKVAVDIVYDGHYNDPPFKYLHSESGLIDLTSPVTTSWYELRPSLADKHNITGWSDTDSNGKLSPCDKIYVKPTSPSGTTKWYHVQEVTVTINATVGVETSATTELWVNGFTQTEVAWDEYGSLPYLDAIDYPTNYIETDTDESMESRFNFSDSSDLGTLNDVKICVYAMNEAGGNDEIQVFLYNSTGGPYSFPTFVPSVGSWGWNNYSCLTTLPSWTEINGGQLRLRYNKVGGANLVHVDAALIQVNYTYMAYVGSRFYIEFLGGFDYLSVLSTTSPVGTYWHEIYPSAVSTRYNITSWTDDTSGNITVGDNLQLNNTATGVLKWCNVTELSTDIWIRGPIAAPPEFPLGAAIEIGLTATVIYLWWRGRRKTKITKRRTTTSLNK